MATGTGATPKHPCISLQESLARYFGDKNYPAMANVPTGATDALKSAQNTNGFQQISDSLTNGTARPTDTSNRTVHIRYVTSECDDSDLGEIGECNLGDAATPLYNTAKVTVTRSFSWGFDLSETQFRDMCEGKDQQFADMVMSKYARKKAGFNKQIVALLTGLMGNYPLTGDASIANPIEIPVVDTNGAFSPTGLALVQATYAQMERMDTPIIVGAGKLDFASYAKAYSAANNAGIDPQKLALNFFRDASVNTSFGDGDDHIFTWAPGAVQLVEWFDNEGLYERTETHMVNGREEVKKAKTTFLTPDGLKWDMYYEFDCGLHKYRFQKWFDVAGIPSDAFGACKDYNYALHFLLSCGAITCNDITAATVAAAS